MSEKVQNSGSSDFICEHCGEPIQKNEAFVSGRIILAPGVGRIPFYHKTKKECLEASLLLPNPSKR